MFLSGFSFQRVLLELHSILIFGLLLVFSRMSLQELSGAKREGRSAPIEPSTTHCDSGSGFWPACCFQTEMISLISHLQSLLFFNLLAG